MDALEQPDRGAGTTPMVGDTDGGGGLAKSACGEMVPPSATQQLTQAIELRGQQQTSPVPTGVPPPTGAVAGAQLGVGSLTASQSQFLSSLAAQNEDAKNASSFASGGGNAQYGAGATSTAYGSGVSTATYGSSGGYTNMQDHANIQTQQTLPTATRTKTQRARVPPPSKVRCLFMFWLFSAFQNVPSAVDLRW